mgnify:CR=1 FL=1
MVDHVATWQERWNPGSWWYGMFIVLWSLDNNIGFMNEAYFGFIWTIPFFYFIETISTVFPALMLSGIQVAAFFLAGGVLLVTVLLLGHTLMRGLNKVRWQLFRNACPPCTWVFMLYFQCCSVPLFTLQWQAPPLSFFRFRCLVSRAWPLCFVISLWLPVTAITSSSSVKTEEVCISCLLSAASLIFLWGTLLKESLFLFIILYKASCDDNMRKDSI